jgi:hypothetical protein
LALPAAESGLQLVVLPPSISLMLPAAELSTLFVPLMAVLLVLAATELVGVRVRGRVVGAFLASAAVTL